MFELQYFFIGFIQGITEFLPISSSAHLILISKLTSWQDQGIFTDICVHVGTLGAVIFYLRIDIKNIILDFFNFNKSNFFAIKIIIATIPAVIIGYLVYEYFILYLRNIEVIAWASIFFGILLFVSDRNKDSNKKWEDLNYYEIILVGLFQVLAFIPGASRAGVTITGSRFLNVERRSAAKFSMLLSIPIILASLILALSIFFSDFKEVNLNESLFATFIAFITALSSIHFMMRLLQFTNFNLFIIYRILLGIIILFFYA
tara:strand:+ start:1091 stop:1870 length:780 start_codon:yes stop_codon:yes gene_type:complete